MQEIPCLIIYYGLINLILFALRLTHDAEGDSGGGGGPACLAVGGHAGVGGRRLVEAVHLKHLLRQHLLEVLQQLLLTVPGEGGRRPGGGSA